MPTLIPEILEQVFVDTIMVPFSDDKQFCEFFEKFMLSGKKPMEIVLNWFSRLNIQEIQISEDYCNLKGENIDICFLYDCLLLKPIINVVAASAKNLEMTYLPRKEVENVVLDAVIVDGLQEVTLYKKLPQKYSNRLRNMTSISVITLCYCLSYDDLFLLRPVEKLYINMPFHEIICTHEESIVLMSVRTLTTNSTCEYGSITLESVKKYLASLNEIFPNAEKFTISISCDPPNIVDGKFPFDELKTAIEMIKNFDPESLGQILPQIQKNITLTLKTWELLDRLEEDDEYLDDFDESWERTVNADNLKFRRYFTY